MKYRNKKLGRHRKGVKPMSVYENNDIIRIAAKYDGWCRICGEHYTVGTLVVWDRKRRPGRKIAHIKCHAKEEIWFKKIEAQD